MSDVTFNAYPFADGSYPVEALPGVPAELGGCELGCGDCPTCGYLLGAAALGGLIAMAEAIRNEECPRPFGPRYSYCGNGAGKCVECGQRKSAHGAAPTGEKT